MSYVILKASAHTEIIGQLDNLYCRSSAMLIVILVVILGGIMSEAAGSWMGECNTVSPCKCLICC